MSKVAKLIIKDEVNCKFEGLDPEVRRDCSRALKFFIPQAKYQAAYRLGRWDGTVNYFHLNGNTYVNCIPDILENILNAGYEIDIVDHRNRKEFDFPEVDEDYIKDFMNAAVWPKGHPNAGDFVRLRDYQVDSINVFLQELQCIGEICTGAGKAQPLDAKILTTLGWKNMGDITLNDVVITPSGDPSKVIGIYPQGKQDVYTITFKDGRQARCSAEHLWKIYNKAWKPNSQKGGPWRVVDTTTLIHGMKEHPSQKFKIPLIQNDISPDQNLPLDPYLLGVLLRDGCMDQGSGATQSNNEIFEKNTSFYGDLSQLLDKEKYDHTIDMMADFCNELKKEASSNDSFHPIIVELKKMGLIGCGSSDKFIPEIYKKASLRQKLELIRGLMGDDSFTSGHKKLVYTSYSEQLVNDVRDVLWGIGAIVKKKQKRGKYKKDGVEQTNASYNLSIRYPRPWELECSDYRAQKIDGCYQNENRLNLEIVSVKKTSTEEVQCIMIDHPDHLYVTDNYIVTHNTVMTAVMSHLVQPYGRSLIIVPSKSLVVQTEADYKLLGLDVGVYYGDRKELGHTHTVSTWQSIEALLKKAKSSRDTSLICDFVDNTVAVIVDECHSVKANVLKDLLTGIFAHVPIRWGLTGTVPTLPHEKISLQISIGEVKHALSAKELMDKNVLSKCHVNILKLLDNLEFGDYQAEREYLCYNKDRLTWISKKIKELSMTGNTLILVNAIKTGEFLQANIPDSVFINGSVKVDDRKHTYDEVSTSDGKVIIATYGVAAVGINIPRIFNLVLFEPGQSFVRVIQSIGRGIRKAKDKDYVDIWDITSNCKYSDRHLGKRRKFYKNAQYDYSTIEVDWMAEA